jgi:hypothetical protein
VLLDAATGWSVSEHEVHGDRIHGLSSVLELDLTSDLKAIKPKIRSGLADAGFRKEPSILIATDTAGKYLPDFQGPKAENLFSSSTSVTDKYFTARPWIHISILVLEPDAIT